jgi:hypothetical protein
VTDDRQLIRELVENWAVWRDAGDWDRFATLWHDDGRMMATWFQGSARDFMRVSQEGFDKGVRILHFLGGISVDVTGERAIAQTKMTISQRAEVDGVLCDVVCTGRFYDFLEKRPVPGRVHAMAEGTVSAQPQGPLVVEESDTVVGRAGAVVEEPDQPAAAGRWGIVLRQPIYEKDRLDPVDPAAALALDRDRLNAFPEGYRHLAYLQAGIGYDVKRDMPGLSGPEVEQLYADGQKWLAGEPLPR